MRSGGWRASLRMARRDALRAKGRSALVAAMVALPVAVVSFADVGLRTSELDPPEQASIELGAADAALVTGDDRSPVVQDPTGISYGGTGGPGSRTGARPWTAAEVASLLPAGTRVVRDDTTYPTVRTATGFQQATVEGVDLTDPIFAGRWSLLSGRAPRGNDEVAVTPALLARGATLGSTLLIGRPGEPTTVVGTVEGPYSRSSRGVVRPTVNGPQSQAGEHRWLVDTPGPVSYAMTLALNRHGLRVQSREVMVHPPAPSEIPPEVAALSAGSGIDARSATVLGSVIGLVLLEVVLLAGPAFAVGVRRQQHDLALLAAAGGERRHLRRVVLAGGLVLGLGGAVLGVVVGTLAGVGAIPFLQRLSDSRFGHIDVRPLELGALVLVGGGTGLLAALVPAVLASRTDVVAALAGRRGTVRTRRGWPVLGLLAVAAGVWLAVTGARALDDLRIVGGTVLIELGVVVAAPAIVGAVGRLASGAPLALRFALRDAARHRGRSAPAVAAVMAAVAGIVALAVAGASDFAQQRADYRPPLAVGSAGMVVPSPGNDVGAVEDAVAAALPAGASLVPVPSGNASDSGCPRGRCLRLQLTQHGCPRYQPCSSDEYGIFGIFGRYPVGDARVLRAMVAGPHSEADAVLAAGGVVVFDSSYLVDGRAELVLSRHGTNGWTRLRSVRVPATLLRTVAPPAVAVLSPAAAARLHLPLPRTGFLLDTPAPLTTAEEQRVTDAISTVSANSWLHVERGFTGSFGLPLLLLAIAGGLAVVGGTAIATGLSVADARPDLATMAAVGAAPRARRLIAMAQAAVIAFLGAGLGLLAGLVPGIAMTWPLTENTVDSSTAASHYLDIPWMLLLAIVVLAPLVAVGAAGLLTRARLPMVRRVA